MILTSLLDGEVKTLEDVPDEMFSSKVMGDGIAIIPGDEWLYSPCSGTISMVFDTKHAIGITTDDGAEILIHIGIDTVALQGRPFAAYVEVDEKVKGGDLLMRVDFKEIEDCGLYPGVMVIATNKGVKILKDSGEVKKGEPLLEI